MIMGKPDEIDQPCAQAWLWSIGRQGDEENKKHAAKLFPIIKKKKKKKHFGVKPSRSEYGSIVSSIGQIPIRYL